MGKINARDWVFEMRDTETDDESAPVHVWVEVDGANSFELNPGENTETVDHTTFRSRGHYEGQAMQRGGALSLEGFYALVEAEDIDGEPLPNAGERDPGQLLVDALGDETSDASIGRIRFRHIDRDEWIVWRVYNTPGSRGGGNNDKTSWSAALTRSGRPTTMAVA